MVFSRFRLCFDVGDGAVFHGNGAEWYRPKSMIHRNSVCRAKISTCRRSLGVPYSCTRNRAVILLVVFDRMDVEGKPKSWSTSSAKPWHWHEMAISKCSIDRLSELLLCHQEACHEALIKHRVIGLIWHCVKHLPQAGLNCSELVVVQSDAHPTPCVTLFSGWTWTPRLVNTEHRASICQRRSRLTIFMPELPGQCPFHWHFFPF